MKKFQDFIFKFISFIVCIALIFGIGCYIGYNQNTTKEPLPVEPSTNDVTLPGETEKRTITIQEVQGKLVEISEFSTYSYEYSVKETDEFTRYLLDKIPILGTTNKISIEATGVIKVGYDFDKITIKVDNESQKIYISLPEIEPFDNYINISNINCTEQNSLLNPIEFSQYQNILTELEKLGEEQAENEGVYQQGEKAIKKYLKNFLSCFENYEIIFM